MFQACCKEQRAICVAPALGAWTWPSDHPVFSLPLAVELPGEPAC